MLSKCIIITICIDQYIDQDQGLMLFDNCSILIATGCGSYCIIMCNMSVCVDNVGTSFGNCVCVKNVAFASCAFNRGFFLSAEKVESEKTAADVTEIVGWYLSLVFSNCNGKCRFI